MQGDDQLRAVVASLSLDELVRIDAALEGDWSGSVSTVWTRGGGLLGFGGAPKCHPRHHPSIELIFPNHWVGLRCSVHDGEQNVFDETLARTLIDLVEQRLSGR